MDDPVGELEPEFYELLGRIATNWAIVEAMIDGFLAHVIVADPGRTFIVSQNVSSATVIGWIKTLVNATEQNSPIFNDVNDLLDRIDGVRAESNVLIDR